MAQLVKNLPADAGDTRDPSLIPWSGRSPGEGNGNPLQDSCLEISMNRGAWRVIVHGVTKSRTQLIGHAHTPWYHRFFTFIKRLFSPSSLSAIKMVSSAYLRLLIFLSEILILACASSSLAFLMMNSAYSLNKQGDNIQP